MKVNGMNAVFGLKSKISIGDRTIVATATGTACFLACLPAPSRPRLTCSSSAIAQDPTALARHQKKLADRIAENEEYYGLSRNSSTKFSRESSSLEGLDATDPEDGPEADFSMGDKDACVLEARDPSSLA